LNHIETELLFVQRMCIYLSSSKSVIQAYSALSSCFNRPNCLLASMFICILCFVIRLWTHTSL